MRYNIAMFDREEYQSILNEIEGKATLCAVSKRHSTDEIQTAYDLGQRIFAENKAQELCAKAPCLPGDIQWHFIGHLQRNKVKQILPVVSCIQSLDSLRLAEAIEHAAAAEDRIISCLIELHLAESDTHKTGMTVSEAQELLARRSDFPHIRIDGMMCMGPHTGDEEAIRAVFHRAQELFRQFQTTVPEMHILSMGMSDDYPIAVQEGATMIRVGSRLFTD
ncbi:MAG: YggS family pyridoxal phosphate-dependent enzyme [Solobacterium sp.]|nr:YggS family pyridoxal phosphate-dependent enzyme [Solobacterium sp.]